MNIYLYAIIFIMGTVFGSFYTLAVYRIPKNIDIIKTHSYCPNCNHKLGFFELIPVLSYIFLGGKCKHCKQKIRIRYLLLELLGGITFVILAMAQKINVYNLDVQTLIMFAFSILYITAVILISGIDKEYIKIEKKLLAYGIIISIVYMIYLYTIGNTSIYRYAIYYLAIYIILLTIETILLRRYAKDSYVVDNLIFLNIIQIFSGTEILAYTVTIAIASILIYMLIISLKQKKSIRKKIRLKDMPIGYFIGVSNIVVIFTMALISNFGI